VKIGNIFFVKLVAFYEVVSFKGEMVRPIEELDLRNQRTPFSFRPSNPQTFKLRSVSHQTNEKETG
jgi:hypothetical protein